MIKIFHTSMFHCSILFYLLSLICHGSKHQDEVHEVCLLVNCINTSLWIFIVDIHSWTVQSVNITGKKKRKKNLHKKLMQSTCLLSFWGREETETQYKLELLNLDSINTECICVGVCIYVSIFQYNSWDKYWKI